MKVEIDIDLNKIDYDAINKQIQEKVAAMDLNKDFSISSKISSKINEVIENEVVTYFRAKGVWSCEYNDTAAVQINDEILRKLHEVIKPHIDKVFGELSQDELHKIISNLLPKVLVDLLIQNVSNTMYNYQAVAHEQTMSQCRDMIHNVLNHC